MQLDSRDITDQQPIPPRFAFARPDPENHMALSDNLSPHLAWAGAPAAAKSFAVVCVDPDVPSQADDVNTEGKTLACRDAARGFLPLGHGRCAGRPEGA